MTICCIIDIDTTLANNEHRAALLKKDLDGKITQESWDAFLHADLLILDEPQQHAKAVLDSMREKGYKLVFLTGRHNKHQSVTEQWLKSHMGWVPEREPLLMRGQPEDGVAASKFKEAKFLQFCASYESYPYEGSTFSYLFFEDDKHVMPIWRKYGLVFQCPEVWQWMNPAASPHPELDWSR